MTNFTDPALELALRSLAPAEVNVGHRLITIGDEHALLPAEEQTLGHPLMEARRASGAARIVARALLEEAGSAQTTLPKSPSGAPVWPTGFLVSLAHDSRVAVAALSTFQHVGALGIDVEPAEPLPADLLEFISTPSELASIGRDLLQGRLLFAAKEAVYKAINPIDHVFPEHHDIEVDLAQRRAIVSNGRTLDLRFCISTHLVALAFVTVTPSHLAWAAARSG